MSLRRIGIILGKDVIYGPKNFILVWVIIAPVLISLLLTLVFGTIFAGKAELGIVDEGNSRLVQMSEGLDSIGTARYDGVTQLKRAVQDGSVDIGLVLPAGFDDSVKAGEHVNLTAYIWGESLAKDRMTLGVALTNLVRDLAGQDAPVDVSTVSLGDSESVPWNDRLLPLIVLMAVFLGGIFVPATALIEEKEKKTLDALVVTPTSLNDVFAAKGIMGIVLSLVMGIVILVLNQAFSGQMPLLLLVLFLGAVMAGEVGLICGALIKDMTTLFAVWKTGGILLFGPAIVYLFPQIPDWVGRIFPTYYLLDPVVTISQGGGGWGDIALNVFILIGLDIVLLGLVAFTIDRRKQLAA